MHISEGVLSVPVLVAGYGLTVAGTGIGLAKLDADRVMTAALLGAGFFVASLIHVPVGPSSMHLIFTGLLGLMLGWAAFPAVLAGLCLQAVLFQYGSITTLGVNTFNMAAPAVMCGLLLRPFITPDSGRPAPLWALCAAAGFVASLAALALPAIFSALDHSRVYAGVTVFAPLLLVLANIRLPRGNDAQDSERTARAAVIAALAGVLLLAALLAYRLALPHFSDLTAMPVNAVVPGLVVTLALHKRLKGAKTTRTAASFAAGALPVLLSSVFTAASLVFTDEGFFAAANFLVLMHIPVALVEGVITVFAVSFLIKVRPEMLARPMQPAPSPGGTP